MTTKRGGGTAAAPAPAIDDDEDGPDPVPVAPSARWIPPFHAAAARQGDPRREYQHGLVVIRADAAGVIRPTSPEEVRVADLFRLPVLTHAPAQSADLED